MAELNLTWADSGQGVEVRSGDVVVVELEESPTTGYRWSLRSTPEPVLILKDDSFGIPAVAAVGAGGSRRFKFLAVERGKANIVLWNWREWEGEGSAEKRWSLTVTVQ